MRKWTLTVTSFTLALGLVALANAQQGGQQPGRGFGGRTGGRTDPVQLLNNASVKKELDLSEEQAEKIPEAVMKSLAEVLSADQMNRFKQIELQQRGYNALGDAKIQDALKLTDEQRSNLKTIQEDIRREQKELFAGGTRGGDFKAAQEKMENFRKESTTKVMGVLTADQKKAWRQMTGEPFKLETPAFGGFGGAGGKGNFRNKKTNNE